MRGRGTIAKTARKLGRSVAVPKERLVKLLKASEGNINWVAARLGITRQEIYAKMKRLGIPISEAERMRANAKELKEKEAWLFKWIAQEALAKAITKSGGSPAKARRMLGLSRGRAEYLVRKLDVDIEHVRYLWLKRELARNNYKLAATARAMGIDWRTVKSWTKKFGLSYV